MNNWTIESIEKLGFKLISNDDGWCRFKSDIFELTINLNHSSNQFNFKSLPMKFKGNFSARLENESDFNQLLKFIV